MTETTRWKLVSPQGTSRIETSKISPRPKDLGPYYPSDYGPHKRSASKRSPGFVHRMMLAGFLGYPGPRWAARAVLWPLWPFWRASSEYARGIPWTGRGRRLDFGCGSGQFLVHG